MNTANLELCKTLYAVSGWHDTCAYAYTSGQGDGYTIQYQANKETRPGFWWYEDIKAWPVYDLGYLLDKLPHFIELIQPSGGYTPNGWRAIKKSSQDYWHKGGPIETQDNDPVNAVCKLAIELFKQGVLVKEQV